MSKNRKIGDVRMFIKKGSFERIGKFRLSSNKPIFASSNTFVKPTAFYSKKYGGVVTSEGTLMKTRDINKPLGFEGYDWLGVQKGLSQKSATRPIFTEKDIPKPMVFPSFSEYFAKDFDKSGYDVVRNATGVITSVKQKPQEYVASELEQSKGGYRKVKSTYVPYEATFTDEGKILNEIKRGVYTSENKTYKDGGLGKVERFGQEVYKEDYNTGITKRTPFKSEEEDYESMMLSQFQGPSTKTISKTKIIASPIDKSQPVYSLGGLQYQYDSKGNRIEVNTQTGKITGNIISGGNLMQQTRMPTTINKNQPVSSQWGIQFQRLNPNQIIEVDNKTGKTTGRVFNWRG